MFPSALIKDNGIVFPNPSMLYRFENDYVSAFLPIYSRAKSNEMFEQLAASRQQGALWPKK